MSRFNKGETSKSIVEKSAYITKSIKRKADILAHSLQTREFPDSLTVKKNRINLYDIHKWNDKDLDIIGYSWNTANNKNNLPHLSKLKEIIPKINNLLSQNSFYTHKSSTKEKNSTYKTRSMLLDKIRELKDDNITLTNVSIELYRVHHLLKTFIIKNNYDNDAYHKIIRRINSSGNSNLVKMIK